MFFTHYGFPSVENVLVISYLNSHPYSAQFFRMQVKLHHKSRPVRTPITTIRIALLPKFVMKMSISSLWRLVTELCIACDMVLKRTSTQHYWICTAIWFFKIFVLNSTRYVLSYDLKDFLQLSFLCIHVQASLDNCLRLEASIWPHLRSFSHMFCLAYSFSVFLHRDVN